MRGAAIETDHFCEVQN